MQYQVPQFIETEDKIVGPFSLRQFAYVGIAAAVTAICYFLLQTWLFFVAGIILVGGALALSFVKINGRPLIKVCISAFNFYWKPHLYIWKPDHPMIAQLQHKPAIVRELPPIAAAIASGTSLHKSWENLQTGTPASTETKRGSVQQLIERKMEERYEIFRRNAGDRAAARRVDYR